MSRFHDSNLRGWVVTIVVALFMVINFMDKAVLGIVAVPLMTELHIHPAEFGLIASSFFLLFSLSAIGFGFLANRVSAKTVLMVLALIWGISQFPLAFVASVPVLFFSRIMLGIGEGPAYPLALHASYKWFPNDRRNLPTAIIYQGVTLGLLISGPVLTYILIRHSWHAAFGFLAVASLVWMVLWFFLGAEGQVTSDSDKSPIHLSHAAHVSYRTLFTDRTFLCNMALYWTTYWIFAVMFTWIPSYLTKVLHYSTVDTGWMFMLFTGINVPITLGGSWFSQRMLKRGVTSLHARGWLSCAFVFLGGVFICVSIFAVQQPLLKVILLAIGFNLPQLTFILSSTIVAEIVPDHQRSGMMSVNSALATTGGLIAPALMGWFIENGSTPGIGYDNGFVMAAILAIVVSLIGFVAINPEASKRRFASRVQTSASPGRTLPGARVAKKLP